MERLPRIDPTYPLSDRDLTEFESQGRAALTEMTEYAPMGRDNKKAPTPGMRAIMKVLEACASLRASYAAVEPLDPAEEMLELERQLLINQEFLANRKTSTTAVRESVRKGIVNIESRLAVLRAEYGAVGTRADGSVGHPAELEGAF